MSESKEDDGVAKEAKADSVPNGLSSEQIAELRTLVKTKSEEHQTAEEATGESLGLSILTFIDQCLSEKGPESEAESTDLEGSYIVVVEDSGLIRRMIVKTLGNLGATIIEAENGVEGIGKLRQLQQQKKDVKIILTDIMMPKMDGGEMLDLVRRERAYAKTPVFVVSTASDRQSIVRCAKYGISGYILKPFKTHQLLSAVQKVLDRK